MPNAICPVCDEKYQDPLEDWMQCHM